jgi:hypothetical protein
VDVLEAVAERIAGIWIRPHEAAFEVDAEILIFETNFRRARRKYCQDLRIYCKKKGKKYLTLFFPSFYEQEDLSWGVRVVNLSGDCGDVGMLLMAGVARLRGLGAVDT